MAGDAEPHVPHVSSEPQVSPEPHESPEPQTAVLPHPSVVLPHPSVVLPHPSLATRPLADPEPLPEDDHVLASME